MRWSSTVMRSPFVTKSFDVVYSNAVIEHLVDHYVQQRFAAELVRVGSGWFVTTPNLLELYDRG
jgi:2-polyprenyl-3-methyl-5-hydroxy-6-metoxy-1,4-benzoquinol methylase